MLSLLSPRALMSPRARFVQRLAAVALALAALPSAAHAGPITSLVVFGDSLSDTGNILALTSSPLAASLGFTPRPANPYYTLGQFTCGPDNTGPANTTLNLQSTAYTAGVWHHTLADGLGVPRAVAAGIEPVPAGTNYAYGGAQSGGDDFISISVATQVERYLDRPVISGNALHAFMAGANDLINAAEAPGATPASVTAQVPVIVSNMRGAIEQVLTRLGAGGGAEAHVLWGNVPPLDLVPQAAPLSPTLRAALGEASATLRAQIESAAAQLRTAHSGLTLNVLDVYTLFNDLISDPAGEGFTHVVTPVITPSAFATPGPLERAQLAPAGANPDQFLFWDPLHPTSHAHALLGQAALASIPTPGAVGIVLFAGVWRGRRRPRPAYCLV